MTGEQENHETEQTDSGRDSSEGGQVSEVDSLESAGETIYPDQATAGYPDSESGAPQEGTAGPNARPEDDRPDPEREGSAGAAGSGESDLTPKPRDDAGAGD